MSSHITSFFKIFFISIQIFILSSSIVFTQTIFEVKLQVTKWAEDRQSAFTFSLDDGYLSHYQNAKPILDQFGFKATFNVMPPFLTDTLPGIWRYGTWQMFTQLANEGHEIASHTLNHFYLTSIPVGDTLSENTIQYELYQSKKIIEERISDKKCITLAYPYSDRSNLIDSLTALFYEAGRSAGEYANDFSLDYYYDLNAYVPQFNLPRNTIADDLDELYTFMNWTHNSILNQQWGIMMLHDLVPQSEIPGLVSELYEPISNEWFTYLCEWLKVRSESKEIWVETTANIVRYMRQRDNYQYQIISSTSEEIKINITDDLDDEIYDYPLSFYVTVPDDWNYVLFQQSERTDTLISMNTDSGKVVLSKIIPDGGSATIKKLNITGIEDEQLQPLAFELHQNYPNPFNPETRIQYQVLSHSQVTLKVFDVLGNEVAFLVNEEQTAGRYKVKFDASRLSSGVYFYQMKSGNFIETKKMLLLR